MPQHIRLREVRCQQSWPSPTIEVSVSSFGLRVNLIPTERADIEHPQHKRLREVRRAKLAPTDKWWSFDYSRCSSREIQ